jgi:arginase
MGVLTAGSEAIAMLARGDLEGIWVHLDVDVLDDQLMPAVDYRQPCGLSYQDLEQVLKIVMKSGKVVGMDVTIFNPKLDPDGSLARRLVLTLVAGLLSH